DELAPVLASVRVYPNPFSSVINFEIASKLNNPTSVDIFNLKGQHVATLKGNTEANGKAMISWNGLDSQGNSLRNGIYLYHAYGNGFTRTGKIVLDK
ncbi:MAG: T9SS type A sorting domain-containing protein, partial [Candidatus Cloacimonas sp.]|nr:T9SS type A sorting domain-containing protein [Candidatus Cloacimonas sp.]